jgi:glycerol kinase
MKAILALDQGTTSSRAILFDEGGAALASAQAEFEQFFPEPGWVEHDPLEIWETQRDVMVEAAAKAGLGPGEVAAIGVTNQRETTVVWERATGRPVNRAIVWQDRRTAGFCDVMKAEGHEETFRERTGLLLDPYFSGTKIRWILDHVDGARGRAERGELAFGTVDSWLIWNLTGGAVHATDMTNASRTLLFNIHEGQWDEALLALLDIPASMLPEVLPSSHLFGEVVEPGILRGVPIAGVAGDQQSALFGQACLKHGLAKNTYGTGCFLLMHTGERAVPSENNLLTTVACRTGDAMEYALEGSVFVGGAVVQWLRDGLGIIDSSSDVEPLAASVPDTGGVYLVPAFSGLGAPHWDPYARGTVLGMTRGTTAAHLARAALEGIAYQSFEVLRAMERDSGISLSEVRVDGGACTNNLLMQFQADVLGTSVVRPAVIETTALGAAYLAGLAVGFWPSREAIQGQWRAERVFEPQRAAEEVDELLAGWSRAVDRARRWAG